VNQLIFPSDEKQKDTAFWTEISLYCSLAQRSEIHGKLIASAVSQRPIIAVYHYVRRARHPMKQQGKWRPDEDAKLIEFVIR
jgi:Myb-like DNA-binding protein REB1